MDAPAPNEAARTGSSGPPSIGGGASLPSPERSPLSVLELHLLTLRESIDKLTDEHALLVRLFREMREGGVIHVEYGAISADPEAWWGASLSYDEDVLLRSLLAD